jgi:hypothetical protein
MEHIYYGRSRLLLLMLLILLLYDQLPNYLVLNDMNMIINGVT